VCKSTPIIRISASSGSSAVRVNTETVYSGRCEAGVVMTSVSDNATTQELARNYGPSHTTNVNLSPW
jgi:hypothetical protein